jgi:DNA-binding NarL/FixJ family response regulator
MKTSMPVTTLVLVDDHHIVRQGIRSLLETESGFLVVGEASTGLEATPLIAKLRPNVVVLDLMMPGMSGLEAMLLIKKSSPETKIIALSMHRDLPYVLRALHNGAAGFVLKESNSSDLLRAVREVMAGRNYLSPPLSEEELTKYERKSRQGNLDIYEILTAREKQVLQFTAEGRSSTEIATKLCISPRTVETHRVNLMRKLGLHSQAEVIRYSIMREMSPL